MVIYLFGMVSIMVGSFLAVIKDKEIRHPKLVNWTGKIIMFCGVISLIILRIVS